MLSGFSIILILFHSFKANATLTEQERNCVTIYVMIDDFGESEIDTDNWNGIYSLDESQPSFNASIWKVNDKWLKYIESHWVLSGSNHDLLIYQSSSLFPPTNAITTWIHEYDSSPALIRLACSSTLSPTSSPTAGPTTSPTLAPTLSKCDVLYVNDIAEENTDGLFTNWLYHRLSQNDYGGRPIWQYQYGSTESFVQYLSGDGWSVFLNNGLEITTYSTGTLFGYFPPLNTPHSFDITTNYGLSRIFTFICVGTDYPSSAPTFPPTNAPTQRPTHAPSLSPTVNPLSPPTEPWTHSPTLYPTIAPSINCPILQIKIPNDLRNDASDCIISFDDVFDDTFWLKQISRENRASFTLDCNDANNDYTTACHNGYSGLIFYVSNQWEISVSTATQCMERFTISNTDYFIPLQSMWLRESTQTEYTLIIQCLDKITFNPSAQQLITHNTIYIYDQTWFWVSLVLFILICCVSCFAFYCYKKKKRPIVVYRPPPPVSVKSISAVSRQELELGGTPAAAYIDPDIAAPMKNKPKDDRDESESKSDMILQVSTPEFTEQPTRGMEGGAGTSHDPSVNPNLKKNVVVSAAVTERVNAGETKAHHNVMSSDHENDDLWDVAKPHDQDDKYHSVVDGGDGDNDSDEDFVVST